MECKDIMTLLTRMVLLANKHGNDLHVHTDGWTAQPVSVSRMASSALHVNINHLLQIQAVQTNDYDCGVWVLACIAAVLKGYQVTGLREEDMGAFRSFMLSLVCCLPTN